MVNVHEQLSRKTVVFFIVFVKNQKKKKERKKKEKKKRKERKSINGIVRYKNLSFGAVRVEYCNFA